jgi:hypothetical protein
MNTYFRTILSIYMALLIIGCGSESSGDSTPMVESSKQGVKVNGIAVDDLIVNGIIKIYSTSTPPILLGEGRTDGDTGSYILNIDYDGVVVLDVTCDDSSQMKNPSTGATQACEDDLSLQSAATLSPDITDIEVNISPVSHLVVQQMKERAGTEVITKEDLEISQDNIGQIFGFDPLGDSPIENETYKDTVGSIRELADDKNITMMEVVDLLNEDMVDGKSGDDGTIAIELASVMEDNGIKNTFTENDGTVVPNDDVVPPVPSPTSTPTPTVEDDVVPPVPSPTSTPTPTVEVDIGVSKAFFDDLRTQAMSVVDYDDTGTAGFLDSESEKLGKDLEDMALNIGLVADYSVGIIGLITEAIDENSNSKSIDIDENNDDEQKMIQKGGEPTVSRTLEVTKTSNPKIWTYSMEDNTSATYTGIVTLPDANVSSITASNFTTLIAKLEGKLPLRDMDSTELAGEQTVKLDLEVKKSAEGADIELKELSIKNGADLVAVKTLKGEVAYDHDTATGDVTIKSVQLDTITLEATLANYTLDGKLDLEYVTNTSIAGKGFEEETNEYQTRINGQVKCAGVHNEETALSRGNMDGNVTYKDQSDVEHSINIENYGDFWTNIEGNVQNLEEGEAIRRRANYYNDYNNYLGLNFDNIAITSNSCSNIVLEDLQINASKYSDDTNQVSVNTGIDVSIFCVDTDGNRNDLTDAIGTFTDVLGVSHTFVKNEYDENGYHTYYEGNSEGITFDSGHKHFQDQDFETFDRVAISNVNSECASPSLEYLDIGFQPTSDKTSIYTYVDGKVLCADNTYASDATVIYTDKSNQTYNLIYSAEREEFHSDWDNPIEGNVEELSVTRGYKNYRAIGWVLPTTEMFSVRGSSCENAKFERYYIRAESHGDSNIYNSGIVPKKAKFVGSIKNTSTSGEINGELDVHWKNAVTMNLTEGSEDVAEITVTLKGKIKMPNRPEMILNLGFENLEASSKYSLSYQYDTTVLNGTATFDKEDDENGIFEFTGTSGIKLLVKVEDGETLYGADSPVTRNGRKIGELQEREDIPVIKYTDGSFESLP